MGAPGVPPMDRASATGGGGLDQLSAVHARLLEDPNTKRAVVSIFDPGSDYGDTKDVPCNNWLQFLHRDGVLHLNVTVRANDTIWGFSGINVFEWSVLHELMASSLGWQVGTLSWFVGTMHVYERHYDTVSRILHHRGMRSAYEFGIDSLPVTIGLSGLDAELGRVFVVEEIARAGDAKGAAQASATVRDPFFHACAVMLRAYNAFLRSDDQDEVVRIVAELPVSDFRVAAIEYFSRRWRTDRAFDGIVTGERDFLTYYRAMRDATAALALR